MPPSLHIYLLGNFTLISGGTQLATVSKPRLQQLLAYIVLHQDSPQPRDRLAFLLWPDSPETQARTNFRNLAHLLRRALPDADKLMLLEGPTVQWRSDAPFTLDVADFGNHLKNARQAEKVGNVGEAIVALRSAVDLYKGDLLPDCYEEWVLREREQIRDEYVGALERLILLLEGEGDFLTATGYAQRFLRYDPLREATYRHLMRLYWAAGDRAGALRVYHNCEAVLERELGVEPGPAISDMFERISAESASPVKIEEQPNNLPVQNTLFIGRERELAEVSALLRRGDVRLVTLTGTAGTGKTRLSLQVAADLLSSFADGAFFVPLAPVGDPDLVAPTLASVLEVRESAGKSFITSLHEHLRDKEMLLLLDNFEQILGLRATNLVGAVPVVEELLAGCPKLRVLVSSRIALNVPGEVVFDVHPLELPDPKRTPRLDEISRYESVALFVERSLDAKRDFALTPQNAPIVAEICSHLEGLPLAIELAAARVKLLPPKEMLERLASAQGRLRVLSGRERDLPQRHETLRNAIAWSYDLLEPPEQMLFRRLGIFLGGCTLEGVEQVCNFDGSLRIESLDGLESLARKSLLRLEEKAEDAPRFSMLETIKEYAQELIRDYGERDVLQRAHAEYYLSLSTQADQELSGPERKAWLERLEAEHDNFRAGVRWGLNNTETGVALQLCGSLWRFWVARGHLTEGRRWLAEALHSREGSEPAALLKAIEGAADLAYYQGDHEAATALYEEMHSLGKSTGDKRSIAVALWGFADMFREQGDYASARRYVEESLALFKELGDKGVYTRVLNSLASILVVQGEYEAACRVYEEVLALCRELGLFAAIPMGNLAQAEHGRGNAKRAEELLMRALALMREQGHKDGIAWALTNLGQFALIRGDLEHATALQAESLELHNELGDKQGVVWVLGGQAQIALANGDSAQALALLKERLVLGQESGNKRGTALTLLGFAAVAGATGEPERAARLGGAAEALLAAIGGRLQPADRLPFDKFISDARERSDHAAWDAAWSSGNQMSLEEAMACALS